MLQKEDRTVQGSRDDKLSGTYNNLYIARALCLTVVLVNKSIRNCKQ